MTEFLNDIWSYYFHDPFDANWTMNSYKLLVNVSTIQDFWCLHKLLKSKVHQGMFFLMREHIFPCWDDPLNKDGCCISIKVLKDNIQPFWETLCIRLLGETLIKEDVEKRWDVINGISTSPKKHFCIIKIWLRDASLNDVSLFNIPGNYHGEIIIKSNQENIEINNLSKISLIEVQDKA